MPCTSFRSSSRSIFMERPVVMIGFISIAYLKICAVLLISTCCWVSGFSSTSYPRLPRTQSTRVSPSPRLPWNDPCGGSNSVAARTGGLPGSVGAIEMIGMIASSAQESETLARRLRMKYSNESNPQTRISNNQASSINRVHFDNLPYYREPIHERDFDRISTIAVFVENVLSNERTSRNVVKYIHEIVAFETSLYTTLCKIKITVEGRGRRLTFGITREVMKDIYRNIATDSIRYTRDYVVIKHAELFLEEVSRNYSRL